MSEGLNRVTLIGNLGADPELRYTQASAAILNFRIAVTERYTDRSQQKQERTEWVTCVLWGTRAEALSKILHKGDRVCVEGRLQTREWEDKQAQKRKSTEVNVTNVVLLGGSSRGEHKQADDSGERQAAPPRPAEQRDFADAVHDDDLIPF